MQYIVYHISSFLFQRRNENTNKKIEKIHWKKDMQDLIKKNALK